MSNDLFFYVLLAIAAGVDRIADSLQASVRLAEDLTGKSTEPGPDLQEDRYLDFNSLACLVMRSIGGDAPETVPELFGYNEDLPVFLAEYLRAKQTGTPVPESVEEARQREADRKKQPENCG